MNDLYSNGPTKDLVIKPLESLLTTSSYARLAAPYFTRDEEIVAAARAGTTIDLLIGLNAATDPEAVQKVLGVPGLSVRFLTRRFHAKIFIFDQGALVGSSNITNGGLFANREATIRLDQDRDADRIDELRAFFLELWSSGEAVTPIIAARFRAAKSGAPPIPDVDRMIEQAVGRAEPVSINASGPIASARRMYERELQLLLNEQYRPSFAEVERALLAGGYRRDDLAFLSPSNEANRFLNWLRLSFVRGDDAWRSAPLRTEAQRLAVLEEFGPQWRATENNRVPATYAAWLDTVESVFGTKETLSVASREMITEGLMSLHAFTEQLRFTKGGLSNVPGAFWGANANDVDRVRRSLAHLVHGPGDFVLRLHDLLYDPGYRLGMFGKFSALELYGTINPAECPPVNGRMAKTLRYLGYDVQAN